MLSQFFDASQRPDTPIPASGVFFDAAPAVVRAPLTVLDIGARSTRVDRWRKLPVAVYGVDADATAEIPAGLGGWISAALAETAGPATLYLTADARCSSLLEPNRDCLDQFDAGALFRVVQTATVTTTTLDALCAHQRLQPDVLKLDVQGTELGILRGGLGALSHALAVETELNFLPLYRDQPYADEVVAFMRSHGFRLQELRRDHWRRRDGTLALVHGDGLFVHDERLAASPRHAAVLQAAYAPARPSAVGRVAGRLLTQLASPRAWRTRLDACLPVAGDRHDPDL